VLRDEDATRGFILIVFEDVKDGTEVVKRISQADEPIAKRLEAELTHSKLQLRTTIEQYEIKQEELRASNEELQAMNEELRSTAEELETGKEELQSVNEELTTVNQELKIKIEELSQANNNFENLMNSTNIGTIFLDRMLKIRLFTPSAQETFNLIPTDLGRPLLDITSRLKDMDLSAEMDRVLKSLLVVEREVRSQTGDSYIMRLAPYRTTEDRIEGLVITLVNVSELATAREDLRRAGEELESRVDERTRDLGSANDALQKEVGVRKRVEEERMELLGQLVSTQEDERRRFARDLHDQLGQQLTSLKMKLESLRSDTENRDQLATALDDLQGIVKQLDSDVDFLAWQLRPVALDDLGLPAALSNYIKQWSEHFEITAEFHAADMNGQRLDPRVETNLYRIAQEALNNCAKHSECSRVDVVLERRVDHVVLIIEDNGVGFDSWVAREGDGKWGLLGMRERAALLDGAIEIESKPKAGTAIYVRVPMISE
jgi:two-component system CheB/CheR fusion protein